jgi:hypothetical protein
MEAVETLLRFGQKHEVPGTSMITADTIDAAVYGLKPLEILLKY